MRKVLLTTSLITTSLVTTSLGVLAALASGAAARADEALDNIAKDPKQ